LTFDFDFDFGLLHPAAEILRRSRHFLNFSLGAEFVDFPSLLNVAHLYAALVLALVIAAHGDL